MEATRNSRAQIPSRDAYSDSRITFLRRNFLLIGGNKMTDKTLWEELSEPALPGIAELFDWALNYDRKDSPWLLFLDVIGWSDEHIGERLTERTYLDGYGMEYFVEAMKELLQHGEKAWRYIDELERLSLEAN